MPNTPQLSLRIDRDPERTIYLSASWRPEKDPKFLSSVIRWFDDKRALVVGDPKGFQTMEEPRVARVMSDCHGVLVVLPFRPETPTKTSMFILQEAAIAVRQGKPLQVIVDDRIGATVVTDPQAVSIQFLDGSELVIPSNLNGGVHSYQPGVDASEDARLIELAELLAASVHTQIPPAFVFFITRLQPDFELPRRACVSAVENAFGLPCLFMDDPGYATNIADTVERARAMIKDAKFIVADLSLADEGSELDNPSRAHEVGIASAYGKHVVLIAQEPRRHFYHGQASSQAIWWGDEADLRSQLEKGLYASRGEFGRHIYNWDILDKTQSKAFAPLTFDHQHGTKWIAPRQQRLPAHQSWILAISFAIIVMCASILLARFADYRDTLDFAPICAALVTLVFASDLNAGLRKGLIRMGSWKLVFPLLAVGLAVATLGTTPPRVSQDESAVGKATTRK